MGESNLIKIVSETTEKLFKKLSGGKVKFRSKIIDNVMVFLGAAGGVGTTTIINNIAYTLTLKEISVLIIDLDILRPAQHNFLKLQPALNKKDLVSFILGRSTLGESIDTIDNISLLTAHNRSLIDLVNCDNELCAENFEEGMQRLRELYDVILIDCPYQLNHEIINHTLYKADSIFIVWDENVTCINNIERIKRDLKLTGIGAFNRLKVIMNKRTEIHYPESVFEKLKIELLTTLPYETAIIESGILGQIFCKDGASKSNTATLFVNKIEKLAEKILEIGGYRAEWTPKGS